MQDGVILVLGGGKTGVSAIEHFLKFGTRVIVYDDNKKIERLLCEKYNLSSYSEGIHFDCMVVSPGIPNNQKKKHHLINYAEINHIPIVSDIEILQSIYPNARYIGITGSNGKSTTTALVGHILRKHFDVQICGNIGTPVLSTPKADVYVMELSSFQLDLINDLRLDIAVCLNITPDHLDCYLDMDDYASSKARIFNNSTVSLISVDYEHCIKITDGKHVHLSCREILDKGISLIKNTVYVDGQVQFEVPYNASLYGLYNSENIVAAVAICIKLNLPINHILDCIASFTGLPHRNQIIHEHNELVFINDSKATNASSARLALSALRGQKVFWIAGGICKDDGIESLSEFFKYCDKVYLIGSSTESFYEVCEEHNMGAEKCFSLENTLLAIKRDNPQEGVVLLSPACASLDQWKNFEERGEYFTKRVKELWSS